MIPQNPTLDKLFEGNKEYRVPLYQRLYVWNKEDQWKPLWEDITAIADTLVQSNDAIVEPHFFGALVLKKSDGVTPDDANIWRVIDGQQRLTTTQLLIAAAADEMRARLGLSKAVARLTELIQNPEYVEHDRRQKMRHGGHNYAKFKDVMSADGDEETIRSLGGEMADCYLYFRAAVREWLNKAVSEAASGDALTTTLRTKLRVVAIYLQGREPEHLIFETLNARGAPLTEWDKIRNYLFYRVEEDQDGFFRQYLERFDDDWWRGISGSGQDARPRTDRFVDYWLESRLEKPVSRSRVFREFKSEMTERSDEDLRAEVELLTNDAEYYRQYESDFRGTGDVESTFHERRRWMGFGAFWPLLLGIRRADLNEQQRGLAIGALESWLVRRWICGYQARNYPGRALDLLKHVASVGTDGAGDGIVDRLRSNEEVTGHWPGDHEVRRWVQESWLTGRKRRMVLEAVEQHIVSPLAGRSGVRREELQIEHLLPERWKMDDWPLEEPSDEAEQKRNLLIQTLGNLTLICGALNAGMRNAAWRKKRQAIRQHDNLFLNKQILADAWDDWNEVTIRDRGEWMAARVCEIWPHADQLRR